MLTTRQHSQLPAGSLVMAAVQAGIIERSALLLGLQVRPAGWDATFAWGAAAFLAGLMQGQLWAGGHLFCLALKSRALTSRPNYNRGSSG